MANEHCKSLHVQSVSKQQYWASMMQLSILLNPHSLSLSLSFVPSAVFVLTSLFTCKFTGSLILTLSLFSMQTQSNNQINNKIKND